MYQAFVALEIILLVLFVYWLLARRWLACFAVAFYVFAASGPTEALIDNPLTRILRELPVVLLFGAMAASGQLGGTLRNWRGNVMGALFAAYAGLLVLMVMHPGGYAFMPAVAELRFHLVMPLCFFIGRALAKQHSYQRVLFWMFLPILFSVVVGMTQVGWNQADYRAALGPRYASIVETWHEIPPLGLSEGRLYPYLGFAICYVTWIIARSNVSPRTRLGAYAALLVLMVQLVLQVSRMAFVGSIAGAAMVVLASGRFRNKLVRPVVLVGLVLMVVAVSWRAAVRIDEGVFIGKLETLFESDPQQLFVENRGRHWVRGFEYTMRYPFGAGLGHSPVTWNYFFRNYPGAPAEPLYSHVQLEYTVVHGGWIGLLLVVGMLSNAVWWSYRCLASGGPSEVRELAVLAFAYSVFVVLATMGWYPLNGAAVAPYFWALLGGLVGTDQRLAGARQGAIAPRRALAAGVPVPGRLWPMGPSAWGPAGR
ncbi:MAG: O-antigen ligase family protein [Pirellulales bacterium]